MIFAPHRQNSWCGGLPPNLSKEDFFRGVSKPVNEELAKLFIRLDLMEQTGYGVPLVAGKYGENAFEFLDFFLRVTIPFAFELENEEANASPQDSTKTPRKTTRKTTQIVLALIKENPYITRAELAVQCGISENGIKWQLGQLKKKNMLRRIGADKGGYWEITDANQGAADEN